MLRNQPSRVSAALPCILGRTGTSDILVDADGASLGILDDASDFDELVHGDLLDRTCDQLHNQPPIGWRPQNVTGSVCSQLSRLFGKWVA